MNPKEKATQLFNKYYVSILEINHDLSEEVIISILAKKQALIAVDEIIEALSKLNVEVLHTEYGSKLIEINGEIRTNYGSHVIYWIEVKNEINKL